MSIYPYASYDLDSYKEGYTFEGWYLDSAFDELLTLDSFDGVFPARDITLYAKYIPKTSNGQKNNLFQIKNLIKSNKTISKVIFILIR